MYAALWDMDGTLVDTADLHFEAWRATCLANGRDLTRAEFFATFGRRNEETIPLLFGDRFRGPAVAALADQKEELYRTAALRGVELLRGARPLLEALAAAGWRQAIGSSAPRLNIEQILHQTATTTIFGAIVSGGDVTNGKPAPDVFQRGAALLGVPQETCVVFEDAPVGVLAAKAAGMRCVAVTFRSHHTADDLRRAGADLVVDDLSQVTVERLVSTIA